MSDLSRVVSQEPDESWPELVELTVHWKNEKGHYVRRTNVITADQFFGRGVFGAPLSGDHVISLIDRLRKEGPPPAPKRKARTT